MSIFKYKILFKFATRSRPQKFVNCIKNIIDKISDKENFVILVSADKDDASMYNQEIINSIKPYIESKKIVLCYGESKSKIDAINRDMQLITDWHILINTSDDMEFLHTGFDDIIRQHFQIHFPNLDGNMHYNDGFTKDKLSTMSIMGKAWYDRFGYIYNPEYKSLYCDEEYTIIARRLHKIQYYDMNLFRHNHPANGVGFSDAQLQLTESHWDEDRAVFERRSKNNFGIL